jgi:hypothetical protein
MILASERLNLAKEDFESVFLVPGVFDCLIGVIHGFIPLLQKKENPQLSGSIVFEGLSNRNKILQALGHFQSCNVQMACVHEVVDPLLTSQASFRLSQLIVVVGELEILTTGVNVNGLAQNVCSRYRALNAWALSRK